MTQIDEQIAQHLLDNQCPYCHVALVVLREPMTFKPMLPGGRAPRQTFTRQCPRCKVLQS